MVTKPRIEQIVSLVLCMIVCASLKSYGQSFSWSPINISGNSYVSLGKVKQFYGFDKIAYNKGIILENKKVKLELRSGSQQCRLNGVLFILSHSVKSYNKQYYISRLDLVKLIDPVMRPTYIGNAKNFNTVILDPGHGGSDSGAVGHLGKEKDYALKVARLIRDQLQQKGYRVVMTRDSDTFISLKNRVNIANKYKHTGAIFISIHFNSGQYKANGIETFTVSPVGVPHLGRGVRQGDFKMVPGNVMDSASIALATAVHGRSLLYLNNPQGNNFKIADRGIKRARFNVLTGIQVPAILFEGGFLSNRVEAAKIHSPVHQKTLASAIVRAIDVYRGSTRRNARP